ncbi:DUF1428 family protein [Paramixta manurensis]|uniref:DUF1428 family protein n=1 Tax=Paramixta manurensis TaxID=2740817 RepID=A0A6M8UHH5_9GAMM|nr:DUF1428 family protein [Erwiniaceae bacterium PD-1]
MRYVEGYLLAVPVAGKEAYRQAAIEAASLFKKFGATRVVECWGDEVPHGEHTDFWRAVKAEAGETVVFSWIEYPSKEVRDAVNAKMMESPRMQALGKNMPFDGKRLVFGGFLPLVDE